jgi:hypothetical protein
MPASFLFYSATHTNLKILISYYLSFPASISDTHPQWIPQILFRAIEHLLPNSLSGSQLSKILWARTESSLGKRYL